MSARFSSGSSTATKPKKAPKNFIYVNLPERDQEEMRSAAQACGWNLRGVVKLAVWQARAEIKQRAKLVQRTGLRWPDLNKLVRGNVSN